MTEIGTTAEFRKANFGNVMYGTIWFIYLLLEPNIYGILIIDFYIILFS